MTTKNPGAVSKSSNSPALSRVALLAGTAAALPLAAHADIIYSGPQNITADANGTNGDQTYTVDVAANENDSAFTFTALNTGSGNKEVYVNPASNNAYVAPSSTSNTNPSALQQGDAIGNNSSTFATGQGTLLLDDIVGNWPSDGSQAYLGIEFTDPNPSVGSSPNGIYYGWIELGVTTTDDATYDITGWAYENTGDPILAGAGQVPEPSSLALFALGGAGVLALRARRKLAGAVNK